jgi:D-alanine-D-alanine ligase
MKQNFGKVAVLMGGTSAEREVSLRSGQAVLTALQTQGVNAVGIDTGNSDFIARLIHEAFDRAFIIVHGRSGEDGTLQGLLEHLKIPYTGSGVLGAALAMDKLRTKQLWQGMNLPTPAWRNLNADTDFAAVVAELGLPLMVKPVSEGSSVGMSKVQRDAEELKAAYATAAQYDPVVIAEQFVQGQEYTVAILNGKPLPAIRLETPRDFYDYAAKYQENTTQYLCPCGLDVATEQKMQALALQAFDSVGAAKWGRVDIMRNAAGDFYLLEVNTVPGMTDHSLVPMAAKAAGLSFVDLVGEILATTL